MADSLDRSISCPFCSKVMCPPIYQCQEGHSMCGKCFSNKSSNKCRLCNSEISTTRNIQFENVVSKLQELNVKVPCIFAARGCKYEISLKEKELHEMQCRKRTYTCEGKQFLKWNCRWKGDFDDILDHFMENHRDHCWMKFNTNFEMDLNMKSGESDLQIIDFGDGQQLFWYKFVSNVETQKAYWLIQCVGLQKQANQYYYEFEIAAGPVRKIKVTEICESDCQDTKKLFELEKCVALPYKTLENYFNEDGALSVRFRIMKIKRTSEGKDTGSTSTASPTYLSTSISSTLLERNNKSTARPRVRKVVKK